MELFEAIHRRASYRKAFTSAPVHRGQLEQIVEAGIRAPTGYNAQTTSFVVVTDPDRRAQIAEATGDRDVVASAQAIIAVIMRRGPVEGHEFDFGVEDYAAATENMMLAVTALGLASVWIDGALRRDGVADRIGELLGVPDGHEVRVILPIGVPEDDPPPTRRRPLGERAWFEAYGGDDRRSDS